MHFRRTFPILLACAVMASPGAAQIGVFSGDDLVAAVAAAPDGETLVLQSNDVFEGTLSWSGKQLTLTAGPGFAPTIRGSEGSSALVLGNSQTTTQARLIGLRIEPGASGGTTSPDAVLLIGTASGPEWVHLELEDCAVLGGVRTSTTGDVVSRVELVGTDVQGLLAVACAGSSTCDVTVRDGCSFDRVDLGGTGDSLALVSLRDFVVRERFDVTPLADAIVTGVVRRMRCEGPVRVVESDAPSDLVFESSLIVGNGSGTGLEVAEPAYVVALNLTITGFEVGMEAGPTVSCGNLVLFGNDDDIAGTVEPFNLFYSLVEDGTFAGQNGNVAGAPLVDDSFRLLPGSAGIDAGEYSYSLGAFDVAGDPRIQDGDGDGVARVNMGALETIGTCGGAGSWLDLGSGANPQIYTVAQAPILGLDLIGVVSTTPQTVSTLLALGVPAASPYAFPGVDGEVLLGLDPFPFLHFALGVHTIPVPNDVGLCGAELFSQAFLLELSGPLLEISAANGAHLIVGE